MKSSPNDVKKVPISARAPFSITCGSIRIARPRTTNDPARAAREPPTASSPIISAASARIRPTAPSVDAMAMTLIPIAKGRKTSRESEGGGCAEQAEFSHEAAANSNVPGDVSD